MEAMLPVFAAPSQQQTAEALPSAYWPSLQVKNTFLELLPDLSSHGQGTKFSRRANSAPPALAQAPDPVPRTTSAPIAFGEFTPQSESEAATILAPLPGVGKGAPFGPLVGFGAHPTASQPSAASASTCSSIRSMVVSLDGDGISRENTEYTFISRENTLLLSRENTLLSRENTLASGENMSQISMENTDLPDYDLHKWMLSPTSDASQTQAWMQWPPMPPPPASTAPHLAPVPGPPPPPVAPPRPAGNCGKLQKKVLDMYELGSPELPTVGSVGHYFRKCKPCAFVYKQEKGGCSNGTDCPFCHLCEPGEKRRRQQGLLDKRKQRRHQRCRVRGEQERNPDEQGHMQEFEGYAEEGYNGALTITRGPHIAAPHSGMFNRDAPEGHAALPLASKATRIVAPGGGSSSKDEEQWLAI